VLAMAVFHQGNSITGGSAEPWYMMGSNQIACPPGNYQQEHNDFSALTFEWTKTSGSTSSITSFSPGRVN
jgi:hypothetical protein